MYKSNVIGYISLTMNKTKHFLHAHIYPFVQRIIYSFSGVGKDIS